MGILRITRWDHGGPGIDHPGSKKAVDFDQRIDGGIPQHIGALLT